MRGYLLAIWSIIDPIYYFFTRLTYPPAVDKERNIFRIRLTKYKGVNVVLSDGTHINKNDTLVKIHLHNVRLLKELKGIKSELKKAKIIYRYVQKSLPGVEGFIRNTPHSEEIKGIIGITLLNKGCERLGFEIIDIIHPLYKWLKKISFLPIEILSSQGSPVKQILSEQEPKYLFMSRNTLSKMYSYDIPNNYQKNIHFEKKPS